MKNNKLTEIKNRIVLIHNLVDELENVIKEAELTEVLNTSNNGKKTLNEVPVLTGSTVNDLDDYEELEERKTHCYMPIFGATVLILVIAITTYIISVTP